MTRGEGDPQPKGERAFALAALAGAVVLAAFLPAWRAGRPLAAQPALWPALALALIAVFGVVLAVRPARRPSPLPPLPAAGWVRPLEYLGWFLAYAWLVPRLGYLPSTLLFLPALVLRTGRRRPRDLIAAAAAALVIVLVFKTLLGVHIPGGALYRHLPEGLRAPAAAWF